MVNLREDLGRHGRDQIEVLSRYLPGRTKENHEKIRLAGAQAKNRSEHLLDASQDLYR
jgi:hypothetical protein